MNLYFTGLSSRLKGDRYIWLIVALLSLMSLLLIYSSTATLSYRKRGGDTEFYLVKHMILLGSGIVFMYLCHMVNYNIFKKISFWGMLAAVLLLLYTLVLGSNINDAKRWVELPGTGLSFQTSDFAKIALILYVSHGLSVAQDKNVSGLEADAHFWKIFIPVLIVCGLIAPANLSTSLILFATCIFMMIIGRIKMRSLGYILLLALAVFAVLLLMGEAFPETFRVETWVSRMRNFITNDDPDVRLQVEQAKIAIAKGGFFGLGPGNGTQSNFLPHAYSDYIYCIIIEEYGLIGGFGVLMLYIWLLIRCVRMVTLSPRAFGSILALGLCVSIVMQAIANMAVSVNVIPVTGVTLPLLSLGGTSVIFTCIGMGIILSVSRYMEATTNNNLKNS